MPVANATPTAQHEQAQAALNAIVYDLKLSARLEVTQVDIDRPELAETNIVIDQGHDGLIHESLIALGMVANQHDARLFLREGELSLVWPLKLHPGPDGTGGPAKAAEIRARGKERSL